MERQEIIRLAKSVIDKFHDNVILTEQDLQAIYAYLFTMNTMIPEWIFSKYKFTLEYLKDVIEEKRYRNISQLNNYFELLITEEEKELHEIYEQQTDDNILLEVDDDNLWKCYGQLSEINNYSRDLKRIFQELFDGICLRMDHKTLSLNDVKYCRENSKFNSRSDFIISGSYFLSTKIHTNHFSGIDKVFIIDAKNSLRSSWVDCIEFGRKPHYITHSDIKYSNVVLVSNLIENNLACHYDVLIDQLSMGQTLFDENFKIHLTEWLLYFKLRKLEIDFLKQRSCPTSWIEWELGRERDMIYQSFNRIVMIFYDQFSKEDWTILKSPNGSSWLTTEDPGFSVDIGDFTSVSHPLTPDPGLNFKKTSVVYFALSKEYCLRIQPKGTENIKPNDNKQSPVVLKESSDIEFKTINSMTVSTNGELLISGDSKTLEQFITG